MSGDILKQRKIKIEELPSEIPDFATAFEPKDSIIKKWIIDWIISASAKKTIKANDIFPKKSEISNYLGVSAGTVQNAIRYVEDEGFLKSKQKTGTMISDFTNPVSNVIKSTSKREKAVIAVKKAFIQKGCKAGKPVPSIRKMAEFTGISPNTMRLAYESLSAAGILSVPKWKESSRYLKKLPVLSNKELKLIESPEADTLVDKLTDGLKIYLAANFSIGDRIPPQSNLAKIMNVSIKTIHDCIKRLNKESIIISRRGRYGSILAQNPMSPAIESSIENSIFAKASDAAFYSYRKTENKIAELINKEYNAGDKLPSMLELSKRCEVSTNTVRKALISLAQDGFVTFSRGKFGGTFVIEKPSGSDKQKFQWLSINPDYI